MTTKRESLSGIETTTSRKIGNNTFEYERPNGETVIRLHMTDIITFKPNGDIVLNTGGWKTVTTKARMNEHLPWGTNVYSDRGTWAIQQLQDHTIEEREVDPVPFVDGIVLPKGRLPKVTKKAEAAQRAELKLKARIKRFVSQIDDLDAMPEPNAGDCWMCSMFERMSQGEFTPEAGGRIAKPGYKRDDNEHLRSHITVKQNYLHGTLIQNAFLWAGASMFLWDMYRQRFDGSAKAATKRLLTRYLGRQLGLTVR